MSSFSAKCLFTSALLVGSPLVAWSPVGQALRSFCSSQSWTRRGAPPLASGSPSLRSATTLNRCYPQLLLDESIAYKKIFSRHFIDWGEGSTSPIVMVFNTLNSFHVREGGCMSGSSCCSTWRASWCSCSSRCPSAWSSPPPSQSPPGSRALAALGGRTCLQKFCQSPNWNFWLFDKSSYTNYNVQIEKYLCQTKEYIFYTFTTKSQN